jgi:hypothetical protein
MVLMVFATWVDGAAPPTSQRPPRRWTGTIDAHKGVIWGIAVARDGDTLVTTGDGKAAVWDLHTGRLHRERAWDEVESLSRPALVSAEKEVVCEHLADILLLDRRSLKTRLRLKPVGEGAASALTASPDGKHFASAAGRTVAKWDAAKGEVVWRHDYKETRYSVLVFQLAFSPDGKVLAVAVDDADVVRLHDAATGREVGRLANTEKRFRGTVMGVTFSPDGRLVAAGYGGGNYVPIWDARTRKQVRLVEWEPVGDEKGLDSLAFSPDGKTLAAACSDRRMRLFEVATGGVRHAAALGTVTAAAFCPDGRLVLSNCPKTGQVRACYWREMGGTKPRRLTKEDLARLWDELGSKDAEKGFQAVAALLGSPEQAVAFLRRLPQIKVTREKLARWVADLDDEDQEVRDRASDQLKEAGHLAESALRDALAKGPSLEGKRRIGKLLKALDPLAPQRLRFLRGVEALEAIASPKAAKQLERLADGAEGAEETEDARAALGRLRACSRRR